MPLKYVFLKSPLTDIKAYPLHAGSASIKDPIAEQVLEALQKLLPLPEALEPAIKLEYIINKKEKRAVESTMNALAMQREDGSFPFETITDSIAVMRAAWQCYALHPEKMILLQMMRWTGYLASNWEIVESCEQIRTAPADLMELLESIYRVTGRKGLIVLCERLRRSAMHWSGILQTFSVQTPLSKTMSAKELAAHIRKENGSEDGFYTRQSLACSAYSLAEGARACIIQSLYSGSSAERTAAETAWKRIMRWHGLPSGIMSSDEFLAGRGASAAFSPIAVGAWLETLAAQALIGNSGWAMDAIDRIMTNAVSAVWKNGEVCYASSNAYASYKRLYDKCYMPSDDQARAVCWLGRGISAALSTYVTVNQKGIDIRGFVSGRFRARIGEKPAEIIMQCEKDKISIKLSLKQETSGIIRLRIPDWTRDAKVFVNGNETEITNGSFVRLERVWQCDDIIECIFPKALTVSEGYHQSVSVWRGAELLCVDQQKSLNSCAIIPDSVSEQNGANMADIVPVDAWTGEIPVRPKATGSPQSTVLVPYATAAAPMSMLPLAAR